MKTSDGPRELRFIAAINKEAAAPVAAGGARAARPRRFHMNAYTGGAFRPGRSRRNWRRRERKP
ncbi:MAG: hypothetical protein FJ288_08740 [Planctomycetes bacterium]|nr:hypothetical protein [Planctomycetota bacterium]